MSSMAHAISTTPANEIWRPVKGYEGYYEVSDLARVRSLDRWVASNNKNLPDMVFIPGKIMSQHLHKSGYFYIRLQKDGDRRAFKVHRLVAEAFVPNPDNLPQVNHKDENKQNNLPSNLEWCTQHYNMTYGGRLERLSDINSKKPIEQLTLDGQHVAYYKGRKDAEHKSGGKFQAATIQAVLSGRRKTAYGYLWRSI